MKINLFEPHIDHKDEKAVLDTLHSKFWASGAGVGVDRYDFDKDVEGPGLPTENMA